jgi:hypothetical protein
MYFHDEVLEDVHKHQLDNSRRTLFIDRFDLMRKGGYYSQLKGPDSQKQLNVTVSAADPGDRIAYFTREASLKRGPAVVPFSAPACAVRFDVYDHAIKIKALAALP